MKFKLPCTWEMYGVIEVEADSLEEAVSIAEDDDTPLPAESTYVDASFNVDLDMCGLDEE